MKPRLPFNPQPLHVLRDKLPAALEGFYDPFDVMAGAVESPSGNPKHVFDFESGLRLIISTDSISMCLYTHVSASSLADYRDKQEALGAIQAAMTSIGLPYDVGNDPHSVSQGKIAHWFFDAQGNPPKSLQKAVEAK